MQYFFTCSVGLEPVPSDTTTDGRTLVPVPNAFITALNSCTSVSTSRVGLLAMRPPSRKDPKALQLCHWILQKTIFRGQDVCNSV